MRTSRLGVIVAVVAGLLPTASRSAPAGLTFDQRHVARVVYPDQQRWPVTFPALFPYVAPDLAVGAGASPPIYYTVNDFDTVWRSSDAGITWAAKPTPAEAGGLGDLATDDAGTLYLSREYGHYPIPAWTSFNGADSWTNGSYVGRGRLVCERHFTAAGTAGRVVHAVRCGAPVNGVQNFTVYGWSSSDSGATYTMSFIVPSNVAVAGPPVFSGTTTVYLAYVDNAHELRIAKSADAGLSWTTSNIVATVDPNELAYYPVVEADDAGNVYVVWSARQGISVGFSIGVCEVFLSRSSDGGATWTTPAIISDPSRTALYPSIAAGSAGRVAVSYYAMADPVDPGINPAGTWNVEVAESIDASSPAPTYTIDVVAPAFFVGEIRTDSRQFSGFLNFQTQLGPPQMDMDDSGAVFIAYPKLAAYFGALSAVDRSIDLMLAVQTGGQKLG